MLPHTRRVLTDPRLAGVPRIHFGVGTGELLPLLGTPAGASVVGVDWRTPLDDAALRIAGQGPPLAVQGNLDPTLVFAPWEVVESHVRAAVAAGAAAPGHIVNLGHGVLPATDPDVLARIVDLVHGLPVPGGPAGGADPADAPAPAKSAVTLGTAYDTVAAAHDTGAVAAAHDTSAVAVAYGTGAVAVAYGTGAVAVAHDIGAVPAAPDIGAVPALPARG